MIWHIVRKDLRVLWPLAALVAALQLLTAALLASHGQFQRGASEFNSFGWVSGGVLPAVCLLGLMALTVAAVQQDRLPGNTQDWLTRPIPRAQLCAAKMLFVLVAGLGPVLVTDVASGLFERLPFLEALAASLTRSVMLYGVICLPAFLIGLVTRSLTEALVLALGIVVALGVELASLGHTGLAVPVLNSGFAWTILLTLLVVNTVAVAVLLPLQLRWRGTNRVRWIATGYLCVVPVVLYLPWSVGFGVHALLAGPGAAEPAFAVRADADRKVTYATNEFRTVGADPASETLALPLTVSASEPDQAWQVDYAQVQLLDPKSGRSLGSMQGQITGDQYRRWEHAIYLTLSLSPELLRVAQERHAQLSATLYMTTFRLKARESIGPSAGPRAIDDFSRCSTTYESGLRCVSAHPVGTCTEFEEPRPQVRRVLRPGLACRNTPYARWPLPLWRDPYFTFLMPRREVFPAVVGREVSSKAEGPRTLLNYVPAAHFTRHVDFVLTGPVERATGGRPQSRDGAGEAARFAVPSGMTADSHGNVFIVDEVDSVVRKMTPAGEVSTFVGQPGRTGRIDGQGNQALFDHPHSIAIDAGDNLYVADTGNALIRRISPAGVVSTVAGGTAAAERGSSGLHLIMPTEVVFARDGSLYVIDHNEDNTAVVRQVLPGGEIRAVAGPDSRSPPRN